MACNICEQCPDKDKCGGCCAALMSLENICNEQITADKVELIKEYAHDLDLIMYEIADDWKELGERLITALPELRIPRDYKAKIEYLRSYEMKKEKGRLLYAECKRITGIYEAYLPFDFVIVCYEPATATLSDNQKKVLMLHELRHAGVNKAGFCITPHDIEDFADILTRYGLQWNEIDQDVPDILDNAPSV